MSSSTDFKALAQEAEQLSDWVKAHRRHLHQSPELSFREERTSAYVREQVRSLGLEPSAPIAEGKYGFYTEVLSKKNPGRFVLLRADMDALPIQEENEVDFRSQNEGVGHLCGHDSHTSMLLGALRLLKDHGEDLPYSVRFVFQHAEEVAPGGAIDFVRAGMCRDVESCFAVHVSPRLTVGQFGLCAGPVMAMVGTVLITVRGRGGHAAYPHEVHDPVLASSAVVMALQQISSRIFPPTEPVVISISTIHGGTASNVIPGEIKLSGTLRTFTESRAPEIEQHVHRIVKTTAEAYGCEADVHTEFSYPPVINDAGAVDMMRTAVTEMFGAENAVTINKGMGAEDFAYFARERPSAFVYIGARPEGATFYPLHHPKFLPDESVFWRGSAALAAMPYMVARAKAN